MADRAEIFISSRQTIILNRLLEIDFPITPKDLADELDISLRTVQREIADLKPVVRVYGLKIMRQFRAGIILAGEQADKDILAEDLIEAHLQTSFSPKDRQTGIICDLLGDRNPVKIYSFSRKYHVTEATISFDLNEVEGWLNRFGLTLVRRPGLGVYIEGEDKQIRSAITAIVNEETLPEHWLAVFDLLEIGETKEQRIEEYVPSMYLELLDLDILYAVERVLTDVSKVKESLVPTGRNRISLSLHLTLAIERHKETMITELVVDPSLKKRYPTVFAIAQGVKKLLDVTLPPEELDYLILHVYGTQPDAIPGNIPSDQTSYLVRLFIEGVEEALGQSLNDPALAEGLIKHFHPALNRIRNGLSIHNPLLTQVQKDYFEIYEACRKSAAQLSEHISVTIPPEEIGYMALHIGAAVVNQEGIKGRAIVVCASGFGTSRLIVSHLKKELPGIEVVGAISSAELSEWLPSSRGVDIILSTIQLPTIKDDRLIVVSPILTERDLQKLKNHLEERRYKLTSPFSAVLPESNTMVLKTAYYGEALAQLVRTVDWVKVMAEEKSLNWLNSVISESSIVISPNRLIEAFKERERQGSFVVGSIAILHSRTDAVRALFAQIVSFENPVNWGSEEGGQQLVTTVLLMAGPPDAPREHFSFLGEWTSGLLNKKLAESLSSGDKEQAVNAVRDYLQQVYMGKLLHFSKERFL